MYFFVLLAGDVVAVRGQSIDSRRGWMQLLLKKSWDEVLCPVSWRRGSSTRPDDDLRRRWRGSGVVERVCMPQ